MEAVVLWLRLVVVQVQISHWQPLSNKGCGFCLSW